MAVGCPQIKLITSIFVLTTALIFIRLWLFNQAFSRVRLQDRGGEVLLASDERFASHVVPQSL
jgi:hypothetical protein